MPKLTSRSLLVLTLLGLAAACDDDPSSPAPAARLRFVHAAQGTQAVDFRVDGTALRSNVAYAANTVEYSGVAPGNRALSVRLSGGTTDAATLTRNLSVDSSYTATLVKRDNGTALVVYPDTVSAPANGKARLRVLNTAPAAGSVDVYVTAPDADLEAATPSATGVDVEEASKYVETNAGTYRVRLTTAGTKTVKLDVQSVALEAGKVRTIIVLDATAGGAPLQSITATDRN
jgi:hypothetical protein